MGKVQRIAALEAEVDDLHREVYRLSQRVTTLEATNAPVPQRPSLADQARTEFRQKWEWLLEAVGL